MRDFKIYAFLSGYKRLNKMKKKNHKKKKSEFIDFNNL